MLNSILKDASGVNLAISEQPRGGISLVPLTAVCRKKQTDTDNPMAHEERHCITSH